MGVLYDYFRAPDGETALRLMDRDDIAPLSSAEGGLDTVEGNGVEPGVALSQALAFGLGVPWSVDLVDIALVWPKTPYDEGGEEWESGVTVMRFSDEARDGFAHLADAALPEIADRWAGIEEFGGTAEPAHLLDWLTSLVGLARRAEKAGDGLFCWSCL
ncbi:hypothetical protein [Spirillospora sp. CA-294931]|uniref:hypothetical protein n=1 Tax=Spirillospora sp. CA-294931 TaxID=3240042 RepID=UPI003D902323